MASPPGYEELLECPYEKTHRIMAYAMSKHLFKCRKSHPNHKLVSCPFNESHHIPEPELKLHCQSCPDRASFETYKYNITNMNNVMASSAQPPALVLNNSPPKAPKKEATAKASSGGTFTQYREPKCPASDEEDTEQKTAPATVDDDCWDDMNVPSYNPQKYCENACVVRKATLKKPAEKKAFYEMERQRLRELKQT